MNESERGVVHARSQRKNSCPSGGVHNLQWNYSAVTLETTMYVHRTRQPGGGFTTGSTPGDGMEWKFPPTRSTSRTAESTKWVVQKSKLSVAHGQYQPSTDTCRQRCACTGQMRNFAEISCISPVCFIPLPIESNQPQPPFRKKSHPASSSCR